jgi:hypothetical protein
MQVGINNNLDLANSPKAEKLYFEIASGKEETRYVPK